MTRLTDILSVHRQPALGRNDFVVRVAGIDQAHRAMLRIPKRRDSHRPERGPVPTHSLLDVPIDRAEPRFARAARTFRSASIGI